MAKTDKEIIDNILPKAAKEKKEGLDLTAEQQELVINCLAQRPELKAYNDVVIGQKIAKIIIKYEDLVKEEDAKLPTG